MFLQIFFGYCALMIIATGILAISLRNPVHCVLLVLLLVPVVLTMQLVRRR